MLEGVRLGEPEPGCIDDDASGPNAPKVTVVICVHSPEKARFQAVLDALANQVGGQAFMSVLVIDNASVPPIRECGFTFPSRTEIAEEPRLGLTNARRTAFAHVSTPWLLLVDDDNILDANYVACAMMLVQRTRSIGAAGGRVIGKFEVEPPRWARAHLHALAVRDYGDKPAVARVINMGGIWEPCGAGMLLRVEVAHEYVRIIDSDVRRNKDRIGRSLRSGGDSDIARLACDMGYFNAYEPELHLWHIIPRERLQFQYLIRLVYCVQRDGWMLYRLRGRQCELRGFAIFRWCVRATVESLTLHPLALALNLSARLGEISSRTAKVLF